MAALSEAEKAFLTMAKMIGVEVDQLVRQAEDGWRGVTVSTFAQHKPWLTLAAHCRDGSVHAGEKVMIRAIIDVPLLVIAHMTGVYRDEFPIVASTFEALTIERPELRPHYDRAREAWEASQ